MQNRQWSRVTRGAKDRWSRVPAARLTPGPSLRGVLGTAVGGLSSTDGPARPVPGAPPLMTTDVPDGVLRGGQPWARPCWACPLGEPWGLVSDAEATGHRECAGLGRAGCAGAP